jgi:hypothetical protein
MNKIHFNAVIPDNQLSNDEVIEKAKWINKTFQMNLAVVTPARFCELLGDPEINTVIVGNWLRSSKVRIVRGVKLGKHVYVDLAYFNKMVLSGEYI